MGWAERWRPEPARHQRLLLGWEDYVAVRRTQSAREDGGGMVRPGGWRSHGNDARESDRPRGRSPCARAGPLRTTGSEHSAGHPGADEATDCAGPGGGERLTVRRL